MGANVSKCETLGRLAQAKPEDENDICISGLYIFVPGQVSGFKGHSALKGPNITLV